jgi:predicted AlkP superfamily phosphohydrolase/phosphomutase
VAKLVFLGLDGVGLDLAKELAARGVMPNLGALLREGLAWTTTSPLPEVSPVCWTTMFSGVGPGQHGVFGFGEHLPGTYQVMPVDSSAVRATRLWESLSQTGRASVVLNVPLTYPATAINGVMVSGFVAPELSRAVQPPSVLPRLEAMGYRPEADLDKGRDDAAALAADVSSALQTRLAMFRELWHEEWDLFCAVITDTDRINHFLWPALWDPDHPLAEGALAVYGQVDEFIGWVWQEIKPQVEAGDTALLIASDHSFGPIQSEVYLNPWLMERGYLLIEGQAGSERILPQTKALALDPGRIYLHYTDRFPKGSIQNKIGAEILRKEIAEQLLAMTYQQIVRNGKEIHTETLRPVERVYTREELYEGPQAHLGPDLVAQAAPGFSLRAGLDRGAVFGHSHLSGTHSHRGAMALWLGQENYDVLPSNINCLYHLMATWLDLKKPLDLRKCTNSS